MSEQRDKAVLGVGSQALAEAGANPEGEAAIRDVARHRRHPVDILIGASIKFNFSVALEMMKAGQKVAREGWNGRKNGANMWICMGQGQDGLPAEKFWNEHTRAFAERNGGTADVLPYIIMKTADNKILMGWLASQSDMLADDWMIVE